MSEANLLKRIFTLAIALSLLALGAAAGCASAKKKKAIDPQAAVETAERLMSSKKKYFKARLLLQDALGAGVSDKDLNARIQIDLADAYFHDGGTVNLAEALSRYTNFLAFNPLHPRADYAQYQVGECHFKQVYSPDKDQAETLKAIEEFRKVGALYPASPYVAKAEERVTDCQRQLAEHEVTVGRFYAHRKAHLAAIDRFKTVLDQFPAYKDKPRIYFYMAESLAGLERADEARAYLKLLLENYPDHRVIPEARELLKEIDRRFPEQVGVATAIEE
jgi:outer membrane protein assembly factor BamD